MKIGRHHVSFLIAKHNKILDISTFAKQLYALEIVFVVGSG